MVQQARTGTAAAIVTGVCGRQQAAQPVCSSQGAGQTHARISRCLPVGKQVFDVAAAVAAAAVTISDVAAAAAAGVTSPGYSYNSLMGKYILTVTDAEKCRELMSVNDPTRMLMVGGWEGGVGVPPAATAGGTAPA